MNIRYLTPPCRTIFCLSALCLAVIPSRLTAADYLGPDAVVASRDGKKLYVACADARQIAVFDVTSRKVTRRIDVPAEPTGLALDTLGRLYVTCAAPQSTVCVIETGSDQISATFSAGHTATGVAVSPDNRQLYVCNRFDNNVSLIDLESRREIARLPVVREPCGVVVSPDSKTAYVANLLPLDRSDGDDVAAVVSVISAPSQRVSSIRLPNGSSSVRGIAISPDGKYVYATHILGRYQMPTTQLERGWMNTNALTIIDADGKKLLNTVLLDDLNLGAANPWGVTTSEDGRTILVAHAGTHELSLIDAAGMMAKLAALSSIKTAAANKEKKDESPANSYATAAIDAPNDLSFLVGLRWRIQLKGNGPHGVAAIGNRAYVAGYFSDTVDVVDLDTRNVDPVTSAALGPAPQLTVQRRGQRLFNDATLCFQHWQSCATCHPDSRVDGLNWDLLNDGLGNPKNTRTMLGAHQQHGAVMALGTRETAEGAVRAGIRHILFAVRPESEAEAMDEYLTSLKPVPSPLLVDGGLSPAAERGKQLFFDPRVGCAACHPAPLYTDRKLYDVGSAGKFDKPTDKFNTPRLVEAWRTAPYMHDGHYLTIREVIVSGKHGAKGPNLDKLTERQIDDLVAFVLSL